MAKQSEETDFRAQQKINVQDKKEVQFWAKELGVTEIELMTIVFQIGPLVKHVKRIGIRYKVNIDEFIR